MTERRFFGPLRVVLSFLVFSSACAVGEIGDGSGGVRLGDPGPEAAPPAAIEQCPGASPDVSAKNGWRSSDAMLPASGTLRFEVKARPGAANLDGLVALGAESIDDFDKAAITVRFAENGLVDVRDGAFYTSDVAYPYDPDVWYSIGISADIDAETYDVEIGPCGEPRETLIKRASFRNNSAVLGWLRAWAVWSSQTAALEISTPAWMPAGGCIPATCESLGQTCGQPNDGCGGSLSCGGCNGGQVCESGACVEAPVNTLPPAVCEPSTCNELGFECGVAADRCGGTIDCGQCGSGQTCSAGRCNDASAPPPSCVPDTCQSLGRECGVTADGCGSSLSCGGCGSNETCNSGVCVADQVTPPPPPPCVPDTCQSLGIECGAAGDGCGGTLSCGGCGSGSMCSSGICIAEPTPPPPPPTGDPTRPWAHNTGPTNTGALVPRGGMTITTDGTVLENVDITGDIWIDADNVTIRNFRINASGVSYGIRVVDGHRGVVIEDGEIFNMSSAAILGVGFTARRLHIHDSSGDGIKTQGSATGPTLVEYCFIEKLGSAPDAHADGNQTRGGSNTTFRYNNIYMPAPGTPNHPGGPYKANATFFMQLEVSNFVIENNWLNGGGYTVYCIDDGAPGVSVRNNIFGRDYSFGVLSGNCAQWSGNVWEDSGQPVSP